MLKSVGILVVGDQKEVVRRLYERYGAMLMGYLLETLKDKQAAEDCLVAVFSNLHSEAVDNEDFTWRRLRDLARAKLDELGHVAIRASVNKVETVSIATSCVGMTTEQHYVFYQAYHGNKPIALIAKQLNKPEAVVKKILASAFAVIRKS